MRRLAAATLQEAPRTLNRHGDTPDSHRPAPGSCRSSAGFSRLPVAGHHAVRRGTTRPAMAPPGDQRTHETANPSRGPAGGVHGRGAGVVLPSCLHGKGVFVPFMSYAILGH